MNQLSAKILYRGLLTISLLSVLLLLRPAEASVFKSGDVIHISNLHTIEDDFYVLGDRVRVDGTIDGDLLALANDCTVQGSVTRSASLCARFVKHSGHIMGSLRAIGENISINGRIDGSVVGFGVKLTVNQGALIARDANLYGNEVEIEGMIIGCVKIESNQTYIAGTIQGDIEIESDQITIVPPAVINGNLSYTSKNEARIDAEGVTVLGETVWSLPNKNDPSEDQSTVFADMAVRTSSLFATFLFGVIVIRLFRPYAEESVRQLRGRTAVSLAAGFLGTLMIGGCLIVLAISLVSALAGQLLITSDQALAGALVLIVPVLLIPIASFASISGGIILYSGSIVTASVVGLIIVRLGRKDSLPLSAWSLLVGLIVLSVLCAIPYLGFLILIAATLTGAGAILLGIKNCRAAESSLTEEGMRKQ